MDHRREPSMDSSGRILGILSLVVALGGMFFLYQENQTLKQEVDAIRDAGGSAEVKAFYDKWNTQLTNDMTNLQSLTQKLEADELAAREARKELFVREIASTRQTVGKLVVDAPLTTSNNPAVLQNPDAIVATDVANEDESASQPTGILDTQRPAELMLAESRLKQLDSLDHTIPIRNMGAQDAKISRVLFRPKKGGEFMYEPKDNQADGLETVVIDFNSSDNSGTGGKHFEYQRDLANVSKIVPANSTVWLTIEIENSDHTGWGMEGDMLLEYANGKRLRINQVRAIFVAAEADST